MAPVVASLVTLLALAGAVDSKPLMPGRHAPPTIANLLSNAKRSGHALLARYYGTSHGLSKPPTLPEKRATSIPSGWTYLGCGAESSNQRLLQGTAFSSGSLTPLLCMNYCQSAGFTIAGMEYTDECYCGNAYMGSGGSLTTEATCSMPCAGDKSEDCGSSWWLSLYTYNATTSSCVSTSAVAALPASSGTSIKASSTASGSAASTSKASGTTASSTNTASAAHPTHTDLSDHSEWYSLGCAVDSASRILTGPAEFYLPALTIDSCLTYCEDKGYSFAGVEYGSECFCGNSVPTTITYSDGRCTMPCTGDSTETCGGDYALDLYELVSAASSSCTVSSTASSTATLVAGNNLAVVTGKTTASATATAAAAATTVASSSNTHKVWAHHMVGNTYPYGQSDWLNDINKAYAAGIDGFALNMGSDSWQPARVADAYTAAASSGTGFQLFLSLDMTSLGCSSSSDAANLVNLVKSYASSASQAMHNGKVLVSTFAGSDCTFGTGSANGWQSSFVNALSNDGVSIFFVPSIFSDPSTFSSNTWMDGELNWNSGWPMGGSDLTTASDSQYMSALGSKEYMPAISPFFFTHFPVNGWNKNWIYRGDDWLYCTRWEQVIAMRGSVSMTEILTWNDYGESSYIGPIAGALPAGSEVWVDGFDHQGINVLTKYYATAFKTGAYPAITKDTIVMWSRPHYKGASASSDATGIPSGWQNTDDYLYAVVLAQSSATVTLTSGSSSQTFSVSAGLTKLKIASQTGSISGSIARNGATVASYSSPSSFSYTNSPSTYNFNYIIGSSS